MANNTEEDRIEVKGEKDLQKCWGCSKKLDFEDPKVDFVFVSLDSNIKNIPVKQYYFCRPCFENSLISGEFASIIEMCALNESLFNGVTNCPKCLKPLTKSDEEFVCLKIRPEGIIGIFHKGCFKSILKRESFLVHELSRKFIY